MSVNDFELPPASGAWREGDDPGRRHFLDLPAPLKLAAGGELPGVRLAYETWGELAPDGSNAVLVLHALTGDAHLEGPAGPGHPTPGWWPGLIEPEVLNNLAYVGALLVVLGSALIALAPSLIQNLRQRRLRRLSVTPPPAGS